MASVIFREVPTASLTPNPWNPNRQSARVHQAELESIRRYGFIDPITVREVDGALQIVDGEHRWRAAKELDIATIPVAVVDIDTPSAKRLTVILNETRGRADPIELSKLLVSLEEDLPSLQQGLPYSLEALSELCSLGTFDWEMLSEAAVEAPPQPPNESTLNFTVTSDQRRDIEAELSACTASRGRKANRAAHALYTMALNSAKWRAQHTG